MTSVNISGIANSVNSPIPRGRAERAARMIDNKIKAIDDKIAVKEKELSAKKADVVIIGDLLTKTNEEIDIIKQLIAKKQQQAGNTEKQIDVTQQIVEKQKESVNLNKQVIDLKKELITTNRDLITAHVESKNALEQIKANNDKLLGLHNGQRGLMVEARDLAIEARNAAVKVVECYDKVIAANDKVIAANDKVIALDNKMIDFLQQAIAIGRKMEAIMMKNPAKYENMTWAEFKNRSEIKEVKQDVMDKIVSPQITLYPKEAHDVLNTCANNVVDATFSEIKTDIKANREILINLPKRIEAVLDKKHESLSVKDIKQIITDHYKSVEQFSRIKKLDYLDLALKNIKV